MENCEKARKREGGKEERFRENPLSLSVGSRWGKRRAGCTKGIVSWPASRVTVSLICLVTNVLRPSRCTVYLNN